LFERERERERVCVCVPARERERERETSGPRAEGEGADALLAEHAQRSVHDLYYHLRDIRLRETTGYEPCTICVIT